MQDENEKAVRTLFEQWWNDKCANMPILDYGYETMAQDIAYHAFKAALQSQVSNTDGWVRVPVEPDIEFLELFVCSGLYAANKPNDELVEKARARWRRLLSAAPKAPQKVSNTPQDGSPLNSEAEAYKQMFGSAVSALAKVAEVLGLDPNDDVDSIISAIDDLKDHDNEADEKSELIKCLHDHLPYRDESGIIEFTLHGYGQILRLAHKAIRDMEAEREATSRLCAELNAMNGPTRMGEPVLLKRNMHCNKCGLGKSEWAACDSSGCGDLVEATPPQQQEQSGEAVKHCNKCGLGKREWAACDAPDCGELVASNSHAKPAAYYAGDLNGQLKDFRVALVDPELEIPLNTPFFLSPQFDASTATPTATASQESAPGQEAVVEAVARVFRDPELGVRVEWLIEGGAGACLDQVLLASPTKLTNDEGYGTVYLAPPTSTAIAAMVIKQAVDICDEHICSTWSQLRAAIAALTPDKAEAELEALMMRVAELRDQESAKGYMDAAYQVSDAAIVRRVLDEMKGAK
jgi:hypothetical protein